MFSRSIEGSHLPHNTPLVQVCGFFDLKCTCFHDGRIYQVRPVSTQIHRYHLAKANRNALGLPDELLHLRGAKTL